MNRATERLSTVHSVKGFRAGKAPFEVLKGAIGEQKIYEEALTDIVNGTFPKALEQEKLAIVGQPKIEVKAIAAGNPFVYTATVALLPLVRLGEIKNLKAKKEPVAVSEKDLDETLKELQRMRQKEKRVNRPAKKGDKVEVGFRIFMDRIPIEGGSAPKHPMVLGEGQLVPGFEEQLEGMLEGGNKKFDITFPKDYHNTNVAGRKAEVEATMHSVFELELPAMDDAFARTMGSFNQLDDLKKHLKESLMKEREVQATVKWEAALVDELIKASTIDELPELLIEEEMEKMFHELTEDLERRGMKLDDYLSHLKKTEETLKKESRPQAERRVKGALVLREIAIQEKVELSKEEVDAEVNKMKESYRLQGASDAQLKQFENDRNRQYLSNLLVNQKVMEILRRGPGQV